MFKVRGILFYGGVHQENSFKDFSLEGEKVLEGAALLEAECQEILIGLTSNLQHCYLNISWEKPNMVMSLGVSATLNYVT